MQACRNSAADKFLSLSDGKLLAQCDVDPYRSSGPGGQKRNKTSSAIRLRHRPTGLAAIATEERSQARNKSRALRRLRQAIALHIRTTLDLEGYTPSKLLASCVSRQGLLCVGRRDQRYDSAVCEILDLLAASEARVSDVAKRIGLTTAHLVKFIRHDPKLLNRVNQMRTQTGNKPLR